MDIATGALLILLVLILFGNDLPKEGLQVAVVAAIFAIAIMTISAIFKKNRNG